MYSNVKFHLLLNAGYNSQAGDVVGTITQLSDTTHTDDDDVDDLPAILPLHDINDSSGKTSVRTL